MHDQDFRSIVVRCPVSGQAQVSWSREWMTITKKPLYFAEQQTKVYVVKEKPLRLMFVSFPFGSFSPGLRFFSRDTP
jgi:hypothetical protein